MYLNSLSLGEELNEPTENAFILQPTLDDYSHSSIGHAQCFLLLCICRETTNLTSQQHQQSLELSNSQWVLISHMIEMPREWCSQKRRAFICPNFLYRPPTETHHIPHPHRTCYCQQEGLILFVSRQPLRCRVYQQPLTMNSKESNYSWHLSLRVDRPVEVSNPLYY